MNNHDKELLSSIDQYIKDQAIVNSAFDKPNIVKRKELESYFETIADERLIDYEKVTEPIKTTYSFSLGDQQISIELFYRYSNYYTRHNVSQKNNPE